MIHTLKCPSCGAPVDYEDETHKRAFRCPFCNNTVVVPEALRRAEEPQVRISFGKQERAHARTGLLILIPVVILLFVGGIIAFAIYSATRSVRSTVTHVVNIPAFPDISKITGGGGAKDTENAFASVAMQFGSEGTGPGSFSDARSIAVDGEGRIYVGEYSGGRIQVFDSSGKFITQWMADTEMPLRAIAADRKGTVYVVQRGEIKKFEGPTGQSLGKVAFSGNGFDDVTALPDGSLLAAWVRASGDHIVRFDPSGRVAMTLEKAISGQSRSSELDMRLAADGTGNIYALGTFNDAVFKFSPDGRYQTRFGSTGDQPGQFRAPDAIAVDNQGRVYVSDFKGVQIFDPNGRYVGVFPVKGSASGMVFNDKNELFVVARTQVLKFNIK